ncbi:MAG: hypothetical protein DMG07_09025 [Acidobacteria bacterium]|nr:MAG: hypothetical protein DMG07_09025 [Acidobacteriota bacterium]
MRQNTIRQTPGQVERAARFHLQAAVRYRQSGEGKWYLGKMVNISRSGVLFQAEHDFAPDTRLEMNINLPVGMGGSQELNVLCSGPIVRKDLSKGELALAARIQSYRLAHQQADPS